MSRNPTVRTVADQEGLQACRRLRREVFVEEQGVSEEEEWDGRDGEALHLLAEGEDGPVGTARVRMVGSGVAKVERVAVRKEFRGRGIGRLLMEAAEARARALGAQEAVLGAQVTAIPFYERLGWTPEGPVFLDAGIPHRKMRKALGSKGGS
ncbi:GNAT family N-acetyltransferase [Myxococcota bacterium]|nr:GNAT family N-acetyltransferase [Myxococcota bacterium]